jgi:glycosyltransferase involved in cell wall biosynthesis
MSTVRRENSNVPVSSGHRLTVAVLVPCLNEGAAIAKVIADFRRYLPDATLFVYDNGSTDNTAEIARDAGAVVRTEAMRGKGSVVQRMFADIAADVFLLVDSDDTYDASVAPELIKLLLAKSLDMVNGVRISEVQQAYRRGRAESKRLAYLSVPVRFTSVKSIDPLGIER